MKKAMAKSPELVITTADLDKFHDLSLPFFPLDLSAPSTLSHFRSDWTVVTCIGVLEHLTEDKVPAAVLMASKRAS